jgi:hypothetical protein
MDKKPKNKDKIYFFIIFLNQFFFIYYLSGTNISISYYGYFIHIISIILLGLILKYHIFKMNKKIKNDIFYNKLFLIFLIIFSIYYCIFLYFSGEHIKKNLYNFILFSFMISEILNFLIYYKISLSLENKKNKYTLIEKELEEEIR